MAKNKDKKVSKKELKKIAATAEAKSKAEKASKKKHTSDKETVSKNKAINIFTHLGLIPKHRAVPFQLSRHYDEVTVERNREQFPYEAEVILDSTFTAVVVNKGKTSFWSRTGAEFQNLEVLGKAFKPKADGIYMAELYVANEVMTNVNFNKLFSPFRKNGLTAPQQAVVDDKALLVVNDYITLEEFITGKSESPHSKRVSFLKKQVKKLIKGKKSRFAIPHTVVCNNDKELRAFAMTFIDKGNKGINVRGSDNPYVCGHQNFHYLHILEGVTHNLKCVGYEEGEGNLEGQVAALLFAYKDGTEVKAPLGRDYSTKASENMLQVLKSDGKGKKKKAKKGKKVKTASSPLGYVWEINALEENSKGVMKSPTVGKFIESKAEF